jgi:hypothetical protein
VFYLASRESEKRANNMAGPGYISMHPAWRSELSGNPPQSTPMAAMPASPLLRHRRACHRSRLRRRLRSSASTAVRCRQNGDQSHARSEVGPDLPRPSCD